MKADCPRLPGASTVGSQVLQIIDETAPMTGKSWQPRHEPHAKGKKSTRHTDKVYTVETREGRRGDNQETMREVRKALQ